MSILDYLIRESKDSLALRSMPIQEVDAAWIGDRYRMPGPPAEEKAPVVPSASLVITRPESFSFQEIEGFLFKRNIADKPANPQGEAQPQEAGQGTRPGNVVQSTALQFSRVNGAGVLLASDGAPESVPGQAGEMRSLLEKNNWSKRPLIV